MAAKPQQIFEYLLAIKNLESPPIRNYTKYEFYRDFTDFPYGKGCYINGEGQIEDAWLEVHKQEIDSAPKPPNILIDWFETPYSNEKVPPKLIEEIRHELEQTEDDKELYEVEKFEDDENRVLRYKEYMELWEDWSKETTHKKKIQELYSYFFALAQQLEREGDTLELAFGHGLLTWKHEIDIVNHPILITYMELVFDAKKGITYLIPTQKGTVLETEMLAEFELSNVTYVQKLRKYIEENDIDPRSNETVEPLYKEFIQLIDPDGTVSIDNSIVTINKQPTLYTKGILFLRKRSGQLIKEDLQDIINKLDAGFVPPKTITALVEIENDNPDQIELGSQDNQAWNTVGEDLLFPLPANEDQKEIARRLSKNFGVTVQGPPGTGKSHTIANLISHLLAHGKRILVTSQKEKALRVLGHKLPEDIRSLCVSVLGGDTKSLQDIEDSIRSISDNMASLDLDQLGKQVQICNDQLKETKKRIALLKMQLKQSAENQHKEIIFKNNQISPLIVAQMIKDSRAQHGWFPDPININQEPPLDEQGFLKFYSLLNELKTSDRQLVNLFIPTQEKLIDPLTFNSFVEKGEKLRKQSNVGASLIEKYNISIDFDFINQAQQLIHPILNEVSVFEEGYYRSILEDYLSGGELKETWDDLIKASTQLINEISQLNRTLGEYEIDLPNDELYKVKEHIASVESHLNKGKKLNKMYFLTTGRKEKAFIETSRINKKPVESIKDLNILKEKILLIEKEQKLLLKWNNTMKAVNGPEIAKDEPRYTARLQKMLSTISKIHPLAVQIKSLCDFCTDKLRFPINFNKLAYSSYEELSLALESSINHINFKQWEDEFKHHQEGLIQFLQLENHHQVCVQLGKAFDSVNVEQWTNAYELAKNLVNLKLTHQEFNRLFEQLSNVAPVWANQLLLHMGEENVFPTDFIKAWEWRQLNTWLDEMNNLNPEKLEEQISSEQTQERKLIERLVYFKTWKAQIERITDKQKRALYAWKQKIKKIGKGTSKYIDRYRREAKAEMDECRSAIPVWIMPIDRVIENFSVSLDQFDVVIVDESSQCDLFSLPVLLRAKKAVIVGDDEQISPTSFKNLEKIHGLMEHYLQGVPQGNSLDAQTSLYDIAVRVFPGKLMLKEHFRCVPEIIQFSNDLSYGGEIIPLRLPTAANRIEPPVLSKRVPGYRDEGSKIINEVEAEQIVNDIKHILTDSQYDGKTIGIISLLGKDQAQIIENMLRNEIGEEEILNRKIICGDSYDFQGDERDIIFLSMVIASNVRYAALVRKDAQQRFNVAVSRAQNQIRLYHSVDLQDLSSSDLRYRLLDYFQNPSRVMDEVEMAEDMCESQFEIDVFKMIVSRGFKVQPQVKAGRRRIDLVVEGIYGRLAVECDGDRWHGPDQWEADMDRQRTLERVGWTFWRVRGSDFYRDRNKAMESLWQKLEEMKIKPAERIY